MKNDLLLEVLSHHGQVLKEDEVESVTVETIDGPVTILTNHTAYFGAVQIGIIKYILHGKEKKIVIGSHGIIEVYKNHVSIVVHTAEKAEDIDINRAQKDREEALEAIKNGEKTVNNGFDVALALKLANYRIEVGKKVESWFSFTYILFWW